MGKIMYMEGVGWSEELWYLELCQASLFTRAKPKHSIDPVKACAQCARKLFYKKVAWYIYNELLSTLSQLKPRSTIPCSLTIAL